MKKSLLLIFTLILSIFVFCKNSFAYSGNYFKWNKTSLYVPLNGNVLDALEEIEVKFYFNGEATDNNVSVKLDDFYYGGISIPTDTVCTKQIKVEATVEGYSNYEKRDITLYVIDDIIPEITKINDFVFNVGEEVNIEEYIKVNDNDTIKEVRYNLDNVNFKICGAYNFTVYAIDNSGNDITKTFTCNVVDMSNPIIDAKNFVTVSYGDLNFDIKDYVTASDTYDGTLNQSITYTGLNLYKLGSQNVEIKVSDNSGNVTTLNKTITVVDTCAPSLELETYYDTIYIEDEINEGFFESYIKYIKDDTEELKKEDVEIDINSFKKEIGSYIIYYTLFDKAGNYTKRNLSLNVTYKSAPEIIVNEESLVFDINQNFDLSDYIEVKDIHDENISDNLYIDQSAVDNTKEGNYEVIISVTNEAGITTEKSAIVKIKDSNTDSEASKISNQIHNFLYNNKELLVILTLGLSIFIVVMFLNKKKKQKVGE